MEKECAYSAKKSKTTLNIHLTLQQLNSQYLLSVYLDPVSHGNVGWPVSVIVDGVPDVENVTSELQKGPYGECVYESANDVCDNQVTLTRFKHQL